MSGMQEQFEIKFRLPDGTDIGPKQYPAASTVATLKETIIAQWPNVASPSEANRTGGEPIIGAPASLTIGSPYEHHPLISLVLSVLANANPCHADKEKGPRTVNDLKLINAGKILENNRTLSECKSPICDFSGMTTMHVVVRAPTLDKQSDKRAAKKKDFRCGCAIM